jgi:hypothetical protein
MRITCEQVDEGKAVYDPETDRYAPRRVVDEKVARGEATYNTETGVYRKTTTS